MTEILYSTMAVTVGLAALARMPLLRHTQRGIIMARALWMLAGEMVEGAWARRSRWAECCERAAREV